MGRAAELLKTLAVLAAVLAAAVVTLRLLDALPRNLAEPPGGRPFATVADLERRSGRRLVLPAYFPQSLRWPPSEIRTVGFAPATVLLSFDGAEDGGARLFLAQTLGGGELSAELMPEGVVLEGSEIEIAGSRGSAERVLAPDGVIWHQVRWTQDGRRLAMRLRGTMEEVLKMARSARREGPR